jgi:Rieske Fe-S protein
MAKEQITVAPDGQPMDRQPAWRTDFPIDWPQDHYVERRDFMKFMVLTSLAFTAGQFWIAAHHWLDRSGGPSAARVAARGDVPVGGTLQFTYPTAQDPCVLVRTGDEDFVAYSQRCTHLSCAVVPDAQAGVIRCPCHNGLFDLASGRPIAGPPGRPLPRIALRLDGDEIVATGVEARAL